MLLGLVSEAVMLVNEAFFKFLFDQKKKKYLALSSQSLKMERKI